MQGSENEMDNDCAGKCKLQEPNPDNRLECLYVLDTSNIIQYL